VPAEELADALLAVVKEPPGPDRVGADKVNHEFL
jgi:hypothetical protein